MSKKVEVTSCTIGMNIENEEVTDNVYKTVMGKQRSLHVKAMFAIVFGAKGEMIDELELQNQITNIVETKGDEEDKKRWNKHLETGIYGNEYIDWYCRRNKKTNHLFIMDRETVEVENKSRVLSSEEKICKVDDEIADLLGEI